MTVFQATLPASGSIPQQRRAADSRSWKVATIRLPADWIGARAGPGTGSGDVCWIDPCSGSRTNRPEWPDAAQSSRSERASAKAGPESDASAVSLRDRAERRLGAVVADGERLEAGPVAGSPDELTRRGRGLPGPPGDLHLLHGLDLGPVLVEDQDLPDGCRSASRSAG